jgi:hypothetical protein
MIEPRIAIEQSVEARIDDLVSGLGAHVSPSPFPGSSLRRSPNTAAAPWPSPLLVLHVRQLARVMAPVHPELRRTLRRAGASEMAGPHRRPRPPEAWHIKNLARHSIHQSGENSWRQIALDRCEIELEDGRGIDQTLRQRQRSISDPGINGGPSSG